MTNNYELPHPLDRKGQLEAYQYILNSPNRFIFVQAPTGSGKSAWVAQASLEGRVLGLVHTKSLQSANYQDTYSFDILYGKANYPCMDKHGQLLGYRTDDCDLEQICSCPYYEKYSTCVMSDRVSLNYAKYLRTRQFIDQHRPTFLFLDECHQLPNIVTDYVGVTLRYDNQFIKWNPEIVDELDPEYAKRLLVKIWNIVKSKEPRKSKNLNRHRTWRYLIQKIETTIDLFDGNEWYFESSAEKLTAKPLTAKYHFRKFFEVAPKVVLMSATLSPEILASELGIDEYDSYTVPNVYPAPMRRIWDLDTPKMSYGSTEAHHEQQTIVIADKIKEQPEEWTGIIHVTSKYQATKLAARLSGHGLSCFIPPTDQGTNKQLEAWNSNRGIYKLCIAWSFHEGVDLGQDQICIVAKVPYAAMGEGYEKARVEHNPKFYQQQTAWKLEQAVGRVRRGMDSHYMPGRKFVALADRNWRNLKRLLSRDFKEAVI